MREVNHSEQRGGALFSTPQEIANVRFEQPEEYMSVSSILNPEAAGDDTEYVGLLLCLLSICPLIKSCVLNDV